MNELLIRILLIVILMLLAVFQDGRGQRLAFAGERPIPPRPGQGDKPGEIPSRPTPIPRPKPAPNQPF